MCGDCVYAVPVVDWMERVRLLFETVAAGASIRPRGRHVTISRDSRHGGGRGDDVRRRTRTVRMMEATKN